MKTYRLFHCLLGGVSSICLTAALAEPSHPDPKPKPGPRHGSIERMDARNGASVPSRKKDSGVADATRNYPRYRLIDLGTLGGDNSFTVLPAVTLNNRGENIAQASTGLPDPFPDSGFTDDATIWHAVLTNANGVVRDLGSLNGNQSLPTWISENGLIAGFGANGLFDDLGGFPQLRAFLWDKQRVLHDLGTLGGNTSQSNSVNNNGTVVGFATNNTPENPDVASFFNGFLPAAQQVRAFVWEHGTMRDLGTLGGNDASAVAINENGTIAGYSSTDTIVNDTTGLPTVHPFFWKNRRMRDLGSLGGTLAVTGSFAFAPFGHIANEQGQVVGTSMLDGDENFHGFVWDKDHMVDLPPMGGNNSECFFISDKGEVLGRGEVSLVPYVRHGFLWEKGRMTDLGAAAPCTRSSPLSMNSGGQIVGDMGACADSPSDPLWFSAFYQEKGKPPVDIHTLITPPSPIHLEDMGYINDQGEISGGGFDPDGRMHAVLLVPIKGPAH